MKLSYHVSAFELDGGCVTAVRAFRPEAPIAVRDAASGLTYRDFLVAALIVDQEDLFPDSWIYIHTPGVRVGRI